MKKNSININELTVKEKIGQMLMFSFHGTSYNLQHQVFEEEFNLGGVIHFARNINNLTEVYNLNRELQKKSKLPMFIALDQEGGPVLRITEGITNLPSAMGLASGNLGKTREITKAVGKDLVNLGFNINFAPVGDVNNNPKNPVINSRSYSDDPVVVGNFAKEAALGFQEAGILPTIKHFPGHGDTSVDSHIGLPVVKKTKAEVSSLELIPFKMAIDAGIDGVMMSHILYEEYDKDYPASLSKNIITNLLREELGFNGLVVTDSLTMGAIWKRYSIEEIIYNGVNAGVDILVFCGKADINEQREIYNTFVGLVEAGRIDIKVVDAAVERILKFKEKYYHEDIFLNKLNDAAAKTLSEELYDAMVTVYKDNKLIPITKDEKVLLLFPRLRIVSLVDNETQSLNTINKYLGVDEFIYTDANIVEAAELAKKYDKVIFATYNINEGSQEVELFKLLSKDKTIVLSLRSPYDILYLDNIMSYVCIYEATDSAFKSASKVLLGIKKATGKLPVKL